MAGEKLPEGNSVAIEGMDQLVVVHKDGMAIMGSDGKMVSFFEINLVKMFNFMQTLGLHKVAYI